MIPPSAATTSHPRILQLKAALLTSDGYADGVLFRKYGSFANVRGR